MKNWGRNKQNFLKEHFHSNEKIWGKTWEQEEKSKKIKRKKKGTGRKKEGNYTNNVEKKKGRVQKKIIIQSSRYIHTD